MSISPASGAWGPRSSIERVRSALERSGHETRGRARDFFANCPVHDENTPSLHVTYAPGGAGGGRVLLHCQGCGAGAAEVVEQLGLAMTDLFDNPPPQREQDRFPTPRRAAKRRTKLGPRPKPITSSPPETPDHDHQWKRSQTYPYYDAAGELRQEVTRWQCRQAGCTAKDFRQAFAAPDGRMVSKAPKDFAPVLYREPQVRQAIAHGTPVWLVEGEKDVHAAEAAGLVAGTNAGGGVNFPEPLAQIFHGADVNVVLDRDDTGWRRADLLHRELSEAGAVRIRIWLPAPTSPKADLHDHFAAGHSLDDLIPVHPGEAIARARAVRLHQLLPKLLQAAAEAHAQSERAAERRKTAPAAAKDHARYAVRWAKEAEILWERFEEATDAVIDVLEQQAGNWAEDMAQLVDRLVEQALAATTAAHQGAGQALPSGVQIRAKALRARALPPEPMGEVLELPTGATPHDEVAQRVSTGEVSWPEYAYLDGGIVQIKGRTITPIINVRVHLDEKQFLDSDSGLDEQLRTFLEGEYGQNPASTREEPQLAAYIFSWPHPTTGEKQTIRVTADRARSGDWLDSIDVPGLNFARDRRGRQEVMRAVEVVSRATTISTQYRGTGWRHHPDRGWVYAHYAGTISAQGWHPDTALIQGAMTRYALPRPTQDPAQLRSAFFDGSLPIMTELTPAAGVVLLGIAYKAFLERVPYSPVLMGSAGSGKTGLAALVQHHYGPAWDRTSPTGSMTGQGSTPMAMRITAHEARDALGFYDDVTPSSQGGYPAAQQRLGEFIQSLYNQEVRDRSTREGELNAGKKPHVTGMFTSEIPPRMGANSRRAIVLPLAKSELDIDKIIALDELPSRLHRSLLLASMIQWAASDLVELRRWVEDQRNEYTTTLRQAGKTNEEADWGGHVWAGWLTLTRFLLETEAITASEQHDLLTQAHANIHAAFDAATDPDEPLVAGTRILEALRLALRAGDIYLTDVHTNLAPDDDSLAIRLGWTQIPATGRDAHLAGSSTLLVNRGGVRAGYVNLDAGEVLIDSRDLEKAVKIASQPLAEPMVMDSGTIRRALQDVGALKLEQRGDRSITTVKRTIHAESASAGGSPAVRRVVAIRLSALLDEDTDPTQDSNGQPPPMPWGPPAGKSPSPTPNTTVPSTTSEDPMPTNVEAVSKLDEPTDCAWCHTPTKWAVDGVPLHAHCWGNVCSAADQQAQVTPPDTDVDSKRAPTHTAPHEEPVNKDHGVRAPESTAPPAGTAAPTAVPSPQTCVAVLDPTTVHLPHQRHSAPEISHLGHIAELAHRLNLGLQLKRGYTEAGVIVLTEAMCVHLGLPVDDLPPHGDRKRSEVFTERTIDHPVLSAALADGWQVASSSRDRLRAWTTIWRDGVRPVRITYAPMLPPALTADLSEPAQIARRLDLFAHTVGIPWRVSPSATGTDLMESLRWRDRDHLFTRRAADEVPAPARARAMEPDFNWTRRPSPDEAKMPYVHLYDRGGSYLAGAASLELPTGTPTHHPEGTNFDPATVGYWLIETPTEAIDWRHPSPLFALGQRRTQWVTTPSLVLAHELDIMPAVLEAWTWDEHGRFLDPWYARIRDARTALDTDDVDHQAARTLLKELYTRTIGMLGSEEHQQDHDGSFRKFYRPEWRHFIIAKARANLLRQVLTIGRATDTWPLAVRADAILYPSTRPDPAAAWPGDTKKLGRGLGQYKPERTGTMADQLEFLTGGQWPSAGRDQHMQVIGDLDAGSE